MSNFKKLVEQRMSETGESWATAARHVRDQVPSAAFEPPTIMSVPIGPALVPARQTREEDVLGVCLFGCDWQGIDQPVRLRKLWFDPEATRGIAVYNMRYRTRTPTREEEAEDLKKSAAIIKHIDDYHLMNGWTRCTTCGSVGCRPMCPEWKLSTIDGPIMPAKRPHIPKDVEEAFNVRHNALVGTTLTDRTHRNLFLIADVDMAREFPNGQRLLDGRIEREHLKTLSVAVSNMNPHPREFRAMLDVEVLKE